MKKLLFVLAIFFGSLSIATADHHRVHAVMHLDDAIFWLDSSVSSSESYRNQVSKELPQHLKDEWDTLAGGLNEQEDNEARTGWIGVNRQLYPEYEDILVRLKVPTKYVIYTSKYVTRMEDTREVLTTDGDLDVARRLMNSPGFAPDTDSTLWGFETADSIWLTLFRYDANIMGVETERRKANQAAHFALWHINDAIREEIYEDPEFICQGPNNHC